MDHEEHAKHELERKKLRGEAVGEVVPDSFTGNTGTAVTLYNNPDSQLELQPQPQQETSNEESTSEEIKSDDQSDLFEDEVEEEGNKEDDAEDEVNLD